MPGGDRSGPVGAGPMTGRGAGWCAGYERPGSAASTPGRSAGVGYRCGGRGWRNMYYATGLPGWARTGAVPRGPAAGQELADLKAQATWLAGRLDEVQKHIEDMEGRGSAGAEQ
jgi:hypothetical protein